MRSRRTGIKLGLPTALLLVVMTGWLPVSAAPSDFDSLLDKGLAAYAKYDLGAAENFFQQAAAIAGATADPRQSEALNDLGLVYDLLNKDDESEKAYLQALTLRQKAAGSMAPSLVPVLDNLAALHSKRRRYAAAQDLYKRSLSILQNDSATAKIKLAGALNKLAISYQSIGNYGEAESLLQKAIALLGDQKYESVTLLSNLGAVRGARGDYAGAESIFKQALLVEQQSAKPDLQKLASIQNRLAALFRDQGKYEEAQPYIARSLEYAEKANDTKTLLVALNNMALLDREQGKYSQADQIYKRVLDLRTSDTSTSAYDLSDTYRNIGTLKQEQQLYDQALLNYQKAAALLDKAGADSSLKADVQSEIQEVYQQQGNFESAERALRELLKEYTAAHGAGSSQAQRVWNDLGILYERQQAYPRAEAAFKEALATAQTAFGAQSNQSALSMDNLAHVLVERNSLQPAIEIYKQVVALRRKINGDSSSELAASLRNYASALRQANQNAEAVTADDEAQRIESAVNKQ